MGCENTSVLYKNLKNEPDLLKKKKKKDKKRIMYLHKNPVKENMKILPPIQPTKTNLKNVLKEI